jgi:hypothetical protein
MKHHGDLFCKAQAGLSHPYFICVYLRPSSEAGG